VFLVSRTHSLALDGVWAVVVARAVVVVAVVVVDVLVAGMLVVVVVVGDVVFVVASNVSLPTETYTHTQVEYNG